MKTRAYLTGPIAVEHDGEVVVQEGDLKGRQPRLLFAYLLLERHRSASRRELMTLLWPDRAPEAWEASLSAVISRTRTVVSVIPGARLDGSPSTYRLTFEGGVWVDFEAAVKSLDAAEGAVRAGRWGDAFGPGVVAATIARREFLPHVDHPWVTTQRQRLKRLLVRSLEALCAVWLHSGQPHLAVDGATEMVARDPLNERAYQLMMEAYASAGHPAAAIQAYHRLRERLEQELGIVPSASTEQLYARMLG